MCKHGIRLIGLVVLAGLFSSMALAGNLAAPPAAPADASKGNALHFDGIDDYVALTGTFGGLSSMTIEAWIKIDAYDGTEIQAAISPTDLTFAHFQFADTGTTMGFYTDGPAPVISVPDRPTPGEWEHWALVMESGNSKLYRNGVEIGSNNDTFATILPTTGLQIGRGYAGARHFNGQIDEVRIWDYALIQDEILPFMYTELPAPSVYLEWMEAYYQMEDGQGTDPPVTVLTDIAYDGRHGTLTNMDGNIDWAGHLWRSGGFTGSNGGLTITNVSFLNDNGDHLDFIHDGGSGTTAADLPSSDFVKRWNRVWTCDVQDSGANGGNIQLVFQSSDAVVEPASKYRLLRRDGASGPFAEVQAADSVDTGADTITFDSVSVAGLCGQITIGRMGNLDSPAPPTDADGQMYTLEQVYDRLTTGAAGTRMTTFTEPAAGPGNTMRTLNDLMGAAPSVDEANGAGAAGVFNGKTFWGLTAGEWGARSGALNLACNTSTFDGAANLAADAYDGAGNGANRWCMTASGDAAAGDILSGKTAWVDGVEVSGERNGGCTCAGTLNGTRWCDNGDGTVTDLLGYNGQGQCLVWAQNAGWGGLKPWRCITGQPGCAHDYDGANAIASSYGGEYDDWRLPTLSELYGLTHGTDPVLCTTWPGPCDVYAFIGVRYTYYWSSTSYAPNLINAWTVTLYSGHVGFSDKVSGAYAVWPVRGGQ